MLVLRTVDFEDVDAWVERRVRERLTRLWDNVAWWVTLRGE